MTQRCPCGCGRIVPVLLDPIASAMASMIEILGPFIAPEAHSRWTAPNELDEDSRNLVEFGETLMFSLQDHLHGELDLGGGQFVRDDAVDYGVWLANAAPVLVAQLGPAPRPVPYSPRETLVVKPAALAMLDDDDLDHRLAHTSW